MSTLRHSEAANAFVDGADVAGGVAAQRHRMVLAAAVDDGRDIHAIVDVQRSDAADTHAAAAFHARAGEVVDARDPVFAERPVVEPLVNGLHRIAYVRQPVDLGVCNAHHEPVEPQLAAAEAQRLHHALVQIAGRLKAQQVALQLDGKLGNLRHHHFLPILPRHRIVDLHSGRGSQCTSRLLAEWARANDVRLSCSRTGNCRDSAKAENFFSMVKTELYYDWEGDDPDIFERDLEKYIDWYNNVRIKRRLDGSSPVEYRLSRAA